MQFIASEKNKGNLVNSAIAIHQVIQFHILAL